MARAVGIDLGTTNSAVAVLEGGEPTIIANAEGGRTTPSVVAFTKGGEVLVGEIAKRQAVTNVDRTIRSVKRHMGTDWRSDDIDGKKYNAQEISARILQKLKRDAEAYLGETVTDAVITVPAYFDDHERQATKEAGEIAGLNVLRIVNEPTAAALAYGLDKGKEDELILVFDLGGGTFDVSLLEVGKDPEDGFSTIQVKRHLRRQQARWRRLGRARRQPPAHRREELLRRRPVQGQDRHAAPARRLGAGQEGALVRVAAPTSRLQYLSMSENGPIHLDETLTRAQFEQMTKDLLDRTKQPFQNVIKDAGITLTDIDHVVLVGGSTRMPAVSAVVKELTGGKEPNKGVNPDEVVALGASPPGRCPQGRAQGRPAHRRHPALARHRDQGRPVHQAHRAQHGHPDQAQRGLLDGRGQPALGADPGLPGRARDRAAEQAAGHLRAVRHRPGPPRRAADRGHLRHRRQRHRARLRQGPRHRPASSR